MMSIQHTDIFAIALHHRFQWEEAQNCYVILFPEGMVKLNGGAGEVLNLVDGKRTVTNIITELQTKFPDAPDLDQDVVGMLELAIEKAWLRQIN
ncbi:Coenzyme PQQ synthesis protein D [Candidatus Methylopumilus turicensis]|jgi:pyrroloquinoline quinone biosynthesis protein D|uniref:PqqA binding protein n=2 Tax=Candidatus Methylopumilus turicensis TaxID=1581680 RepID=A0A0B7IZ74_9PROT|nr:pyrroloquinoline quinone biosynthesis peptide chaperone PqqD [Candidatus Methylopumilus turicensis]CEN55801.1 Coenzyme PQQ synthesis protein D [Candidatus Methylopumilus turicensis]